MTISEVSMKYDISSDTLRYYERIGLIPYVTRNKSGIRDFNEEDCRWVKFAKCMRSAGLQVETLIEYLALFQKGESTIPARMQLLIEQRDQLLVKVTEIQETLERLDYKIGNYENVPRPKEDELKQ